MANDYVQRILDVQAGLVPGPTHRPFLSDYLGRYRDPTNVYLADMYLWSVAERGADTP
jgi:hypothetical protein